jgi:hypothetical protein
LYTPSVLRAPHAFNEIGLLLIKKRKEKNP